MKTVDEIKQIAKEINALFYAGFRLGDTYQRVRFDGRKLTGVEFVRAMLVGQGRCLPEVALLSCPATDYLCVLDLDEQQKHVLNREPFEVVNRDCGPEYDVVDHKTFDQLTEEDCKMLFRLPSDVREMAAGLDGDQLFYTFQGEKKVGSWRIHRDT